MSKQHNILIISGLWIGSLALAYYVGGQRAVAPNSPSEPDTVGLAASPQDRQMQANVAPAPATPSSDSINAFNQPEEVAGSQISRLVDRKRQDAVSSFEEPARPSGPIAGRLRDALADSDPISRMANFTDALQDLGPHNVDQVLQAFNESGKTDDREFAMFLYAWAKFDGPAAMAYTKENNRRGWQGMQNSYNAMSGYAAHDPVGAEQWARDNFDGQDNPYLIGVINGVSKTDLQKATDITFTLPYGRIRGKAVDILIEGQFKEGNEAAMNWANELPEGVLKNGIVSRVTSRLTRDDPQLAAQFVETLAPGEEQSNASVSLAESWSRSDPKAASEWAAAIPDDQARAKALEEAVDNWSRRDKEAAGAFLEAQPKGAYLDGAIKEYAERLRFDDPVNALTWAATVTDENKRYELMERIAEEWADRDPEAAAAFLQK